MHEVIVRTMRVMRAARSNYGLISSYCPAARLKNLVLNGHTIRNVQGILYPSTFSRNAKKPKDPPTMTEDRNNINLRLWKGSDE